MINGDNKTLEVSSVKTKKMLLKIQKKGDFAISCFDMQDEFIAYSDNVDTQILQFNQTTLQIVKLTKKICVKNGLERLEAAKWMKIVEKESHNDQKTFELIMITQDLKVLSINLNSLEITQVEDLKEIISSKLNA